MKTLPLRNYSTAARAEVYARTLRARWPNATFVVRPAPWSTYEFRFLIYVSSSSAPFIGRSWVGHTRLPV